MNDVTTWLWPLCLGTTAVFVLVIRAFKGHQPQHVLPIIHRRRELQEELNGITSPEIANAFVRDASRRLRRPSWDTSVLEAAVRSARAIEAQKKQKWTTGTSSVRPAQFR